MIPVSIIIAANIVANDFLKLLISTPSFLSNVPLELYKAPLNILMVFDKIFKEISCSNKFFYFNLGQRLRKLTKLRTINATKCVDLTSFLLARKTCAPHHLVFHFLHTPSKKLAGVYASAKNNSSISSFCKKMILEWVHINNKQTSLWIKNQINSIVFFTFGAESGLRFEFRDIWALVSEVVFSELPKL